MSLVLVGGSVRSGKSAFALSLARARQGRRLFLATAQGKDQAMAERIARHVRDRGGGFRTIEEPLAIPETIARLIHERACDVLVLDCLTLWISNMLCAGASEGVVEIRVADLLAALTGATFPVIVVSNEVGMGVHPETELGIVFRDVVGRAHQSLAGAASEIYLAALGTILRLKPGPVITVAIGGAP